LGAIHAIGNGSATSQGVGFFPAFVNTQQLLSSVSQSSTPKKCPPPYVPPKINDRAAKRAGRDDDDDDDDNDQHVITWSKYNADDDSIDITSAKEDRGVPGQSSHLFDAEREMIERHRAVFKERTFATPDGDDGGDAEGFYLCRLQSKPDLIAYVVWIGRLVSTWRKWSLVLRRTGWQSFGANISLEASGWPYFMLRKYRLLGHPLIV
jgi:hypothetical protein